ncbi:DUF881 domain-containing protein [Cellulomonas sp. NTE-D12]|uniref:DUF881 domain-containing protein n=1 Tax=Cellulomonas sp. NTE-D12 TaxID=2962632 RepID=UPI0030821BD8|nr:hypothetical protein CELD12_18850 [Cellulomonas sp. NTE-D12]
MTEQQRSHEGDEPGGLSEEPLGVGAPAQEGTGEGSPTTDAAALEEQSGREDEPLDEHGADEGDDGERVDEDRVDEDRVDEDQVDEDQVVESRAHEDRVDDEPVVTDTVPAAAPTPDLPPDAEDDAGAALRESHAWQLSAEAVASLPPEAPPTFEPEPTSDDAARAGSEVDDGAAGATPEPSGAPAPSRPMGWAALGSALRPRATRAQVLAGVLCAVLGFAIVVQLRQNGDSALSQLRQDDLVRLLDEASTRSDQLSREAADLQRERDQLVSGSNNRQAAIDAARRSAATQGILAGRLPAVGPGVRITVTDNGGSVRPITMLNMLEELRNAGAEAVQLNDQRVTASSAFTGSTGAVQLDGTTLTAPYVWLVIGDPDTIATALDIPGGAMAYVRNDGGSGSVDKLTEVHVDALRPAAEPRYATPAAVPGS